RPALPPRGCEGGRHATRPLLDGEPFRSQQIAVGLRRLVFPPRGLGVLPDLQVKVGEPMGLLVDPVQYKALVLSEAGPDSVASVPSRYIETEYSGASRLKASLPHSAMRIVRPSDIASLRGEAPLLKEPARPLLHHLVAIVRPPLRIVDEHLLLDVGSSRQGLQALGRHVIRRRLVHEAVWDQHGEPRLRHRHGDEARELHGILAIGGSLRYRPSVGA